MRRRRRGRRHGGLRARRALVQTRPDEQHGHGHGREERKRRGYPSRRGGGLPARGRPHFAPQPSGLGTRCRPPVVSLEAVGVDDRARHGDERARRPARECARDVGRRRALRADPGQQQDRLRQQPSASLTARGYVAPTTAPMLERPHSPTTSSPSSATSFATCCQTWLPVREREILDVGAAGIRRLHEAEDPAPGPSARGDERLERIPAEIRAHGHARPPAAADPFRGSR